MNVGLIARVKQYTSDRQTSSIAHQCAGHLQAPCDLPCDRPEVRETSLEEGPAACWTADMLAPRSAKDSIVQLPDNSHSLRAPHRIISADFERIEQAETGQIAPIEGFCWSSFKVAEQPHQRIQTACCCKHQFRWWCGALKQEHPGSRLKVRVLID